MHTPITDRRRDFRFKTMNLTAIEEHHVGSFILPTQMNEPLHL